MIVAFFHARDAENASEVQSRTAYWLDGSLFFVVVALGYFAAFTYMLYDRIPVTVGGGLPIRVLVDLKPDISMTAERTRVAELLGSGVPVDLIHETEDEFCLLLPATHQIVRLPRDAVGSVRVPLE
jgi:hypothetical protein